MVSILLHYPTSPQPERFKNLLSYHLFQRIKDDKIQSEGLLNLLLKHFEQIEDFENCVVVKQHIDEIKI